MYYHWRNVKINKNEIENWYWNTTIVSNEKAIHQAVCVKQCRCLGGGVYSNHCEKVYAQKKAIPPKGKPPPKKKKNHSILALT